MWDEISANAFSDDLECNNNNKKAKFNLKRGKAY